MIDPLSTYFPVFTTFTTRKNTLPRTPQNLTASVNLSFRFLHRSDLAVAVAIRERDASPESARCAELCVNGGIKSARIH
jgi:hypothetical protein